jgi:hypothetical protein
MSSSSPLHLSLFGKQLLQVFVSLWEIPEKPCNIRAESKQLKIFTAVKILMMFFLVKSLCELVGGSNVLEKCAVFNFRAEVMSGPSLQPGC